SVIDAGAYDGRDIALDLEPDPQDGSGLQGRGVQQFGDRPRHASGVFARIAGFLESLRDLEVGVERDDVFGIGEALVLDIIAGCHGYVLRNDPNAIGGVENLIRQRVAETLRHDIMKRGYLDGPVRENSAGFAN